MYEKPLPEECTILEAAAEWGVAPWIIEPGLMPRQWMVIWAYYQSIIRKKQQR